MSKIGWKIKTLGEVCDIQNGFAFKSESYVNNGARVIRISNVQKGFISDKNPKFIDINITKSIGFEIYEGDILVSLTGDVGRVGIFPEELTPAVLNQRVGRFCNINTELVLKEYLFLFLNSDFFESCVILGAEGAAQKNTSTKKIKAIEILLPSLVEQERIVKILDNKFEAIRELMNVSEQQIADVEGLFESRLSEIFKNPEDDWKESRLSELGFLGRGKSKHRPRNDKSLYDGEYPFVQTGDIRNAPFILEKYTQTYNEKGLKQSKLWPKGTLCITIAANIAETSILGMDVCFPDSIIGFIPENNNSAFYQYLMMFNKIELQKRGKGSAQDNINLGTFESISFMIPPDKKQIGIVKELDELSEKMKKLEIIFNRKIDDLIELKKSYLEQAFSGNL